MPAVVVNVIGATVHKHASEMLAEGTSREDVATWVQTVRHVLQERVMTDLTARERCVKPALDRALPRAESQEKGCLGLR
jgi:hypothetical protein